MKEIVMWVLVKFWRLLSCLPRRMQFRFSGALGKLSLFFAAKRFRVIKHNLTWCFSSKQEYDVEQIIQDNIRSFGQAIFDTGVAWFWTDAQVRSGLDYELRGLDAFLNAQKQPQGILLISKHSQHLELDGRILGLHIEPSYGVGRRSNSKVMNDAILQGRAKSFVDMSDKTNPRQFVRWLQDGNTIIYLPDQDSGGKRSVKTTLFGVPARFSSAAYTLVKLSGCMAWFCNSFYEGEKLIVELEPLTLPMDHAEAFSCSLARYIESKIAKCPAEYMWSHRRFKSTKGRESYA